MLCVTKCPDIEIDNINGVQEFAIKEGSNLCRYDVPIDKITDDANKDKCPQVFPVWKRYLHPQRNNYFFKLF